MTEVMIESAPIKKSPYDSPAISAYLEKNPLLKPFFEIEPNPESIALSCENRVYSTKKRKLLVDTLHRQYHESGIILNPESPVAKNLEALLSDEAYTVTAGQQIHAYLGPGLVLNKILSVLALAKSVQDHTKKPIIPIFWMATEDHDFEEINHLHLFGKDFSWPNPDQNTGPVGRKKNTGLPELGHEIKSLFQNDAQTSEWIERMISDYANSENYAQASRKIIHHFFESTGLIVIDPDDRNLKQSFRENLLLELKEPSSSMISNYDPALKSLHIKPQIHPRETNLFVVHNGNRERLIKHENEYRLATSGFQFSTIEMENWLNSRPEDFSPNVALRPIYQEFILPNLAYVAGSSEMIYWFQIKDIFEKHQLRYPAVWLRTSAIYLPNSVKAFMENAGFTLADFMQEWEEIQVKLAEMSLQSGDIPHTISAQILTNLENLEDTFRKSPLFDKTTLEEIKQVKKEFHHMHKALHDKFDQFMMNGPIAKKLNKVKIQYFTDKQERTMSSITLLRPVLGLIECKEWIKYSDFSRIFMVTS